MDLPPIVLAADFDDAQLHTVAARSRKYRVRRPIKPTPAVAVPLPPSETPPARVESAGSSTIDTAVRIDEAFASVPDLPVVSAPSVKYELDNTRHGVAVALAVATVFFGIGFWIVKISNRRIK